MTASRIEVFVHRHDQIHVNQVERPGNGALRAGNAQLAVALSDVAVATHENADAGAIDIGERTDVYDYFTGALVDHSPDGAFECKQHIAEVQASGDLDHGDIRLNLSCFGFSNQVFKNCTSFVPQRDGCSNSKRACLRAAPQR